MNDFGYVRMWIWIALAFTLFYCCCVTPFSSLIFSCCFIGDEEAPPEGKKPKADRVATFTSGMQKSMFDPQTEYFTGLAKRFRKAPEDA